MTRDEMRAKCLDAMEVGAHKAGHIGDLNELLTAAFDALSTAGVRVCPVDATNDMVQAALWEVGVSKGWEAEIFRAMSAAGDLTNPPEKRYDIGGGIMMSSRDFGESPERKP